MNRSPLMNKTLSPRSQKNNGFRTFQLMKYDFNSKSLQPQNKQTDSDSFNHMKNSFYDGYQNKKFKIRFTANSVKSARNYKFYPLQRIRKVQNLIQNQKRRHLQLSDDLTNTIDYRSLPISPHRHDQPFLPFKHQHKLNIQLIKEIVVKNSSKRQKQIQQIIKTKSLHEKPTSQIEKEQINNYKKQIHQLKCHEYHKQLNKLNAPSTNLQANDELKSYKKKDEQFHISKVNMYSQIVKNRKKLTQRRNKKKMSQQGLLQRIKLINQYNQQYFVLRNSLHLKQST